jgi:3-deoxy-D-manno-octulosonic-acid transferase
VIVPRHPQRFDKVEQICQKNQLLTIRYSLQQKCTENTDVLLIDAMGLLNSVYAIANIAFVGGSIADRGGHNALEPATFAVPILMGPNIYNNPVICQTLMNSGALVQVAQVQQIVSQCDLWLTDTALAETSGQAGLAVLKNNRGAVAKTMLRLAL